MAVANGAHILSTEWLTASREAGRWLPEADFAAEVGAPIVSVLAIACIFGSKSQAVVCTTHPLSISLV